MHVPRKLQPVCLLALPKEYIGLHCNHRCAMEISFGQCYSRTGVTRTLKGNEKQFELARDRIIGINSSVILIKEKKLVWVTREFRPSVFKLSRFYNCTSPCCKSQVEAMYLVIKKIVELTLQHFHGQNLISRMHGSSGHNENFTKKCGISKIICDTACRAIYLNTRTRLILKGWLI